MSASDFFCSSCEGLCTCRQIQLSLDGGLEPRIKRLKFPIRAEEQEMRCKASVPLGRYGGMREGDRLEVAAAGLWRQRQSLSCWKSFGALCVGGYRCVLSAHSQECVTPMINTPPSLPPSLQLKALISRCPHPRRAFILYCQHAIAASSRLSTFEDVYPSGLPWNTFCTATFRLCTCVRLHFVCDF